MSGSRGKSRLARSNVGEGLAPLSPVEATDLEGFLGAAEEDSPEGLLDAVSESLGEGFQGLGFDRVTGKWLPEFGV